MLRGTQLEPAARAAYEQLAGLVMQPLVVLDGEYSASLDGLTLGGDRVVEIKCPVKGRDSALWNGIEAGGLPEHYQWQVQHQLMVTKADIADVFVFDGSEGVVFPVAPNPSTWPRIHAAWDEFARFVKEAQAPPLTDRDTRLCDDPEWLRAAAAYLDAKRAADIIAMALDEAKSQLVRLTNHAKEQGGGRLVTRLWKAWQRRLQARARARWYRPRAILRGGEGGGARDLGRLMEWLRHLCVPPPSLWFVR